MEIGDLIEGCYLIYIDLRFGLDCLHRLPSILFLLHLFLPCPTSTAMRTSSTSPIPSSTLNRGTKLWGRSLPFPFLQRPYFRRSHWPVGVIQEERVRVSHQVGIPLYSLLMGCTDRLPGKIPGLFAFDNAELILSKPLHRKGNHHHPTDEEREARDKRLFVYCYNQGGEKTCRDNSSRPYPSYTSIHNQIETSKYCHDQFRELGLGDLVMTGKERWRKHVKSLNLEGFPKAWISRGLREIHHVSDHMDGSLSWVCCCTRGRDLQVDGGASGGSEGGPEEEGFGWLGEDGHKEAVGRLPSWCSGGDCWSQG